MPKIGGSCIILSIWFRECGRSKQWTASRGGLFRIERDKDETWVVYHTRCCKNRQEILATDGSAISVRKPVGSSGIGL